MECEEHKNSICRVCLKCVPTIHKNGASILYKTDDVFIYEKLNTIANVDIKPEDGLPDRICIECLLELHNAILFKHKCETSNNVLLSALYTNIETSTKEPDLDDAKLEDEHYTDHEDVAEEPHTPLDKHIKHEPEDEQLQSEEEDVQPVHQTKTERTNKEKDLKLECNDCGGIFRNRLTLKLHWKKEHLKEYLTCDKCKNVFSTFKTLNNHKKSNSFENCVTLSNIFRIEGTGKCRKFFCKQCKYFTIKKINALRHTVTHTGMKRFVCELCKKSFTQLTGLNNHKEDTHKIYKKEESCGICGKFIQGRTKFNIHMRKHKNEKNTVICDICHKVYKNKCILKVHMERHFERKYACDVCSKKFPTSSNLIGHKRLVHEKNAVHICSICGYKHYRVTTIRTHISKHNGVNSACVVCGRFFENDVQLNLHKQRHNNRNNKCTECGKTFFRKKCLLKHLNQIHNLYCA